MIQDTEAIHTLPTLRIGKQVELKGWGQLAIRVNNHTVMRADLSKQEIDLLRKIIEKSTLHHEPIAKS